MSVFQKLLDTIKIRGACYVILIDPDKKNDESIYDQVEKANRSDVDAIFVGKIEHWSDIKTYIPDNLPIIAFPTYNGHSTIDRGHTWFDFINKH